MTGRGKNLGDSYLNKEEYLKAIKEVLEYESDLFIKPNCAPQSTVIAKDLGLDPRVRKACIAGTSYCSVVYDGRVNICPYAEVEAGNLRENSFLDIWNNSPVFEKLRDFDLRERKYILAHDDETGKLMVHILTDFSEYKLSEKLDEVFAYWRDNKFVVAFLLDNEKSAYVPEGRFKIFEGHLKNSLIAILKSERKLRSDDLKITLREEYKSADPNLNLVREDKNLYDYIYGDDGLEKYNPGFDYKSLAHYKKKM
ncbi:MAG: SPASM domain-containing protein [Anaerococcus sp.]|nr:SPASM domain-containing protein [Anaerococcus sp.]